MQQTDAIAEQLGLGEVVSREDDGLAAVALAAHEVAQEARGQHVEADGGLVEHEHRRVVQHGARHGEPLALARRERLAAPVEERREIQNAREQRRPLHDGRGHHAVQATEVAQQLAAREARVEARRPGEEAELPARGLRVARDVDARELGAPRRGREDGGQHAQRRRLARAVRAE